MYILDVWTVTPLVCVLTNSAWPDLETLRWPPNSALPALAPVVWHWTAPHNGHLGENHGKSHRKMVMKPLEDRRLAKIQDDQDIQCLKLCILVRNSSVFHCFLHTSSRDAHLNCSREFGRKACAATFEFSLCSACIWKTQWCPHHLPSKKPLTSMEKHGKADEYQDHPGSVAMPVQ